MEWIGEGLQFEITDRSTINIQLATSLINTSYDIRFDIHDENGPMVTEEGYIIGPLIVVPVASEVGANAYITAMTTLDPGIYTVYPIIQNADPSPGKVMLSVVIGYNVEGDSLQRGDNPYEPVE